MARSVAAEAVIPIEAVLLCLAILIASGRLLPRSLQHQRLNTSDGFVIASIVDAIGLFITDVLTYKWGGMSDDESSAAGGGSEDAVKQLIALKKVQFAGNAFYDTGIYFPKIAILALYFRLFPSTMPWLRKSLYAVTCFTVCAMISTFFLDTFWCGSFVSVNWSPDEDACSSFASTKLFRIDWALNITADAFIFILPFPLLQQLQLNRRQIWGLVATFSLGAITISMSIVRFATIEVIFAWTNVFVLSMAEMAVAIMVVSLPAMRAFVRRGTIFSSNKKSASSSSRGYGLHTPAVGTSSRFASVHKSKQNASSRRLDDSGSEVELNYIGTRPGSGEVSKEEHD